MHFKNIYVNGASQALKIMGIPEMPVANIEFENMIIRSDIGVQLNYTSKIAFKNLDLRLDKPGIAVSFSNSQNVSLDGLKSTGENQMFWVGGLETKDISLKTNGKKMVMDKDLKVLESIKGEVKVVD
ncbi:hypothetical protein D3C72_968680 [compost metagenome]